jgi:glycosyltransferase involved in cell wall biosynthesis
MKLSILILTHNRPNLFTRCLSSVLNQITDDVEVIVNNDSNDITEIRHPQVTYHYNKFSSLCEVYQFLLAEAKGEYVYFLEDDDYLSETFLQNLSYDTDMFVGNYFPMYDTADKLVLPRIYTDAQLSPGEFLENLNEEHLQLSQHVYKRSTIVDFEFPRDSHINNDILLTRHAARNSQLIETSKHILYCQTIDGGDNISF